MNLRYLSPLLLICTLAAFSQEQADRSVIDGAEDVTKNYWELHSPQYLLNRELMERNPLLRWSATHANVTAVALNTAMRDQKERFNIQEGGKYRNFNIEAFSQIELNKQSLIWGEASYINSKTENITFNNNADIKLIYPYVMADSLGGKMASEQYAFCGGYIHQFNSKLTLATELNYRAIIAYRDRDPRPRNTVSDLTFKVGLGHTFNQNYLYSLALTARKYKQQSAISFMSDTQRTPIYHLSGLGERIVRFDGTYQASEHEGYALGVDLGFNEVKTSRWIANIGYDYLHIKKIMSSIEDLPLQKIKEHNLVLNVGLNETYYNILLFGRIKSRKGYENIYGAPQNGYFNILATVQPYKHTINVGGIKTVWTIPINKLTWHIGTEAAYESNKELYKNRDKKLESKTLHFRATSTLRIATNRAGYFSLTQQMGYSANITKDISLESNPENPIKELTQHISYIYGKNKMTGRVSMHWDLPFKISVMHPFIAAIYETQKIATLKPMHFGEIKLGIIF